MPPQRRQREYETAVDPDALHIDEGKVTGFGEKRSVIKDAELEALRSQAQQAETLREQLIEALAQQGQGNSALAVQDGSLMVQGFQFSPTGLIAPDEMSYEMWTQVGKLLFRLEGSIQWLIGDWLAYGANFGYGDVKKLAIEMGREPGTFWEYAYVCRSVESWVRTQDLSYGHHKLVASLTPDKQKEALAYAVEEELSISEFRKALRGNKKVTRELPRVSEDEGNIIVSDIQRFAANLHAFESLPRDERQAAILRVKKLLKLWESVDHD